MAKRDSTIIYRSFYEAIKELPAEDKAQVWDAVFEYSLNFKSVQLTGVAKTVFTLIKPQLDANIKRYKSGTVPKAKRTGSETEAKPKRKVSESQNIRSETEANENVNENVNVNQNENENENACGAVVEYFNISPFEKKLNEWIMYRKQIGKSLKKITRERLPGHVLQLAGGVEEVAMKIIDKSINNGWQGLFPLDQNDIANGTISKSQSANILDDFLAEHGKAGAA